MNKPLISVVIPVHNRKKLIKEALASVLNQEPKNYEVIVVDDGSTDGTADSIRKLKLPIKILSVENGGPSRARNIGLKESKGIYILFLDSDDLLLPNILRLESDYLVKHSNAALVYSDYFIELEGKMMKKTKFDQNLTTEKQMKSFNFPALGEKRQAPLHISSTMFKRELLVKLGGFNENLILHEDPELYNRISETSKFNYINKPLAIYRMGKDPNHLINFNRTKLYISEGRKYIKFYLERRRNKKIGLEEKEAIVQTHRNINYLNYLLKSFETKRITKKQFDIKRWGPHYLEIRNQDKFYLNFCGLVIKIVLRKTNNLAQESTIQGHITLLYQDFFIRPTNASYTIEIVDKPEIKIKSKFDLIKYLSGKKHQITTFYGITPQELDFVFKSFIYKILTDNKGFILQASAIEKDGKANLFVGEPSETKKITHLLSSKYQILSHSFSILKSENNHFFFYQHPFLEKDYVLIKKPHKYAVKNLFFLTKNKKNISTKITNKEKLLSDLLRQTIGPNEINIKTLMKFASLDIFHTLYFSKNEPEVFRYISKFNDPS